MNVNLTGDYKIINTNTGEVIELKSSCISLSVADIEFGVCELCGSEFQKAHGHQRFCPPQEGRKISRCQNTFNQRKKRKRAKEAKAQ